MADLSPSIVIGIPTFRRPTLLRILLESLVEEVRGRDVLIVIADNECGAEVPALARSFEDRMPAVMVVAEPTRGISANRNALVQATYERAPAWQWLVMVDDDGRVAPGWLQALLDVAARTGAHVTGGAVEFPLPDGAGIFARNSDYSRPRRHPSGPIDELIGAQSICFARKVEQLVQRPWFDAAFGLSGGEDQELFWRLKQAGAQFAFANESLVIEPTPPERATAGSVLHRSFTSGVASVRTQRRLEGRLATFKTTCGHLFRVSAALVVHSLLGRKDRLVRTVINGAFAVGRLPGMARLTGHRYEWVRRR